MSKIQLSYRLGSELLWGGVREEGREGARDRETETIKYLAFKVSAPVVSIQYNFKMLAC